MPAAGNGAAPSGLVSAMSSLQAELAALTTLTKSGFSASSWDLSHARAVANARRKLSERAAWLSPPHTEWREFAELRLDSSPAWYLFTPVYSCPGTMEKVPSAAVQHDGGKWICGLKEMAEAPMPCVVYSFGSNWDFRFEEHVHAQVPHCAVHTFDPTSGAPSEGSAAASFVHFHSEYGISGSSEPPTAQRPFAVAALKDIMHTLDHTSLDVLKIDVEGSEWSIIAGTDWRSFVAGQLLLELHPQLGGGPVNVSSMQPYFERLEEAGYLLASLEPVTYSNFGQVEVTFVHESWVPGRGFRF